MVFKKSSFLGKQTLLLRENTERMDGLENGLTHLIGINPFHIEQSILKHLKKLEHTSTNEKTTKVLNPLKRASEIVADVVYEKSYA